MGVRIDRIRVNRGGPLEEDFVLEPADLNLIYGHNESGKTYIVESIINLLFRTGRGATVSWGLREWDLAGRIVVSGLHDEKVEFTLGSRKLDDYWTEEAALPRDLSSLLVVKAGETRLRREGDGVGRDILKDCLSGEGILDRIERRISATLRESTLEHGRICGANRGELKNREQLRDELEKIDTLLRDVQEGYASADIFTLQQEQARIEAEVETLQRAKRYHAGQLHNKMLAEKLKREALPTEQDLSELEQDIRAYEEKSATADTKSTGLKELKGTTDDFIWTEKALAEYQEFVAQQVSTAPKLVYISLALAFLAGATAVLVALLGLTIPLIVLAVLSIAFIILFLFALRRALATAGYSQELENLKAEFKSRYGTPLTDKAALEAQLDRLRKDYFNAEALSRELDEDLLPDISTRKNSISLVVQQLTGRSVSPQKWRKALSKVRKRITRLDESISMLDRKLASLDVPESEYPSEHPGVEWDRDRYDSLQTKLSEIRETLNEETKKLDTLKARLKEQTGTQSTDWEELIDALGQMRDETAEAYREITAKILAKILVNDAIQEFRQEENARIAEALTREELTVPLHALTGRYNEIRQDLDRGLVLVTEEDEEFALAALSTGAQEQSLLALRIGFASIAMQGGTAFLVLDDAFQHSDWVRRENLITLVLGLVQANWQVFYFTMDDHIRDLFHTAGAQLGDEFTNTIMRC